MRSPPPEIVSERDPPSLAIPALPKLRRIQLEKTGSALVLVVVKARKRSPRSPCSWMASYSLAHCSLCFAQRFVLALLFTIFLFSLLFALGDASYLARILMQKHKVFDALDMDGHSVVIKLVPEPLAELNNYRKYHSLSDQLRLVPFRDFPLRGDGAAMMMPRLYPLRDILANPSLEYGIVSCCLRALLKVCVVTLMPCLYLCIWRVISNQSCVNSCVRYLPIYLQVVLLFSACLVLSVAQSIPRFPRCCCLSQCDVFFTVYYHHRP